MRLRVAEKILEADVFNASLVELAEKTVAEVEPVVAEPAVEEPVIEESVVEETREIDIPE